VKERRKNKQKKESLTYKRQAYIQVNNLVHCWAYTDNDSIINTF